MCVAGFPGADCQCRDCRTTCPLLKRSCSIRNKCEDCEKDVKQMDKILGIPKGMKLKQYNESIKNEKIAIAKKKAIEAIREYRLLLENDKNEKLDEILRELSIV